MVELDRARRGDEVDGVRAVGDRLGSVEHLEDPLEADHRRHQVDAGVRQAGERLVHPRHQGRERHERAEVIVPSTTSDGAEP